MGEGHHGSQEDGVARGSARAHQVCGDNRFTVARRESVDRPQPERDGHTDEQNAEAEIALMEQAGEVSVRRSLRISGGLCKKRGDRQKYQ